MDSNPNESCCGGCSTKRAVPSVHQSLDEMDFERGLWSAAMNGDSDRVERLLCKNHDPNLVDASGYTPLHYAARGGHTKICKALLSAGASVNASTRAGKSTALHRAALYGHEDTVRLLLQFKADGKALDSDGRTSLHRAVEGQHVNTIKLLLEAFPTSALVADIKGKTPSDYATDPNIKNLFDQN